MNKQNIVTILLALFLVGDLVFSFAQYYNTPLYGDTAGHIMPDGVIQKVFDDPLGIKAITTNEKHPNPNRFFVHFTYNEYFLKVPIILQKFANPVSSVYLAAAIIKILVQIMFLYLLASFISQKRSILSSNFLVVAALTAPLFQAYGYWSRMGINDKSIAYTFFYAVPLVFLMLFLKPVLENLFYSKPIQKYKYLFLLPLTIILPLSGPLIPAISGITILLIFIWYVNKNKAKTIIDILQSLPVSFYVLLTPLALMCIYSIFLGFYNSQNQGEMVSLTDRFMLLPQGIWKQLFHSFGVPLLLSLIGLNIYLIKRNHTKQGKKLLSTIKWIGIFIIIYIVLLPLGGYRSYRPLIIRHDTILPVTVLLIYIFTASSYNLLRQLKGGVKRKYLFTLIVCLTLYTAVDYKGIGRNKCERLAFDKMKNSEERIIKLPKDCYVMDWSNTFDYNKSEGRAKLIYYWNITPEIKFFYNEQ